MRLGLRQQYKKAVEKGFQDSIEVYQDELKQWRKSWGKPLRKKNGHFVFYKACLTCGKKKFPHISKGRCTSCYQKSRKQYKDDHRRDNL